MNRREFLKKGSVLASSMALGCGSNSLAANILSNKSMKIRAGTGQPNIIVLLVDDLGYSDLGCFNSPYIQTPNLDKLAADGMRLTSSYAGSPLCSPARSSLMTGRIAARTGVYSYIPADQGHPMHLRTTETTIATVLIQAGYNTAHFGKWHLNTTMDPSLGQPEPNDHGFDYHFGVCGHARKNGAAYYLDADNFWRNGVPVNPSETLGYSCKVVADDAISWVGTIWDKNKPFFMQVSFNEPHNPMLETANLPPEMIALYSPLPIDDIQKRYYATITNLDHHIGRFLDKLDELHLREDTLVMFVSDNGPHEDKGENSKLPLRGYKGECCSRR